MRRALVPLVAFILSLAACVDAPRPLLGEDGGFADSGSIEGADAGLEDADVRDGGPQDAGRLDAGRADAAPEDTGPPVDPCPGGPVSACDCRNPELLLLRRRVRAR